MSVTRFDLPINLDQFFGLAANKHTAVRNRDSESEIIVQEMSRSMSSQHSRSALDLLCVTALWGGINLFRHRRLKFLHILPISGTESIQGHFEGLLFFEQSDFAIFDDGGLAWELGHLGPFICCGSFGGLHYHVFKCDEFCDDGLTVITGPLPGLTERNVADHAHDWLGFGRSHEPNCGPTIATNGPIAKLCGSCGNDLCDGSGPAQ